MWDRSNCSTFEEGGKRARRSAACSNRYVRALPPCVHSATLCLLSASVSRASTFKDATRLCAMKLSLEIEIFSRVILYIIFSHTFCSSLDGERIYRPCHYCIHRALFLQPRCVLLTWLWLRVIVLDERRRKVQSENGLMIFLFSFSFSIFFHPSPAGSAAQRVFAHELGNSSTMPCCICKRARLQRGHKQGGGCPVVSVQCRLK